MQATGTSFNYLDRFEDARYTIRNLRQDLVREGLPEDEIRSIIRQVDDLLLERVRESERKRNSWLLKLGGILLFIISACMSLSFVGSFFGIAYFLYYGPLATGTALFLAGVAKSRQSKKRLKFSRRMGR